MTSEAISFHLDTATFDQLAIRGRETGESRSQRAQRYIEEGLRMERHPDILFRSGPAGRRAALVGGPDVWEVVPVMRNVEREGQPAIPEAADWLGILVARVLVL
jgi:hypothetical protein